MAIQNNRSDWAATAATKIPLSVPFRGAIHSVHVLVPLDWRRRVQDRALLGEPGLAVLVAMGGNTGHLFAEGSQLHDITTLVDTIIVYLDPLTLDDSSTKFDSGHVGLSSAIFASHDDAFLVEVLHHLRTHLQRHYDRFAASLNAAIPGSVPVGVDVLDPKRLYLVGYSAGAVMCYRLAEYFPRSHRDDPYEYRLAAVALYTGCAGGYHETEGAELGVVELAYLHSPRDDVALLHVHGGLDDQVSCIIPFSYSVGAVVFAPPTADAATLLSGYTAKNSADGYVNMGYDGDVAIQISRWDWSTETSVGEWATAVGLGAPFAWISSGKTPAPTISGEVPPVASYEWAEFPLVAPGTHEVLVIRIDKAVHGLPLDGWPNLYHYFAAFLIAHPRP